MVYFEKDFIDFFKELAANNLKKWFDANRERYKKSVKAPFEQFVTDVIAAVKEQDPTVDITPKEAIFRINRDIRFSKDKAPYKLHQSAVISPRGRKDKAYPGLYVELGPEHCRIYGGVYSADKEQIYAIRSKIASAPQQLDSLANEEAFKTTFGAIRGEKNKIIPKEFKEVGQQHAIIYNKQWYWFTQFPPERALSSDFLAHTLSVYAANTSMMNYFRESLK